MKTRDIPRNTHGVPRSAWKKWTLVARHVFNMTFEFSMSNQDKMCHPKQEEITKWKTIAWNHAWIAADICSRGEKLFLKDLDTIVRGKND